MPLRKYRVVGDDPLPDHVPATTGDTVYELKGDDYGHAVRDSNAFEVRYVSVTFSQYGDYPFFTIPLERLEEVEPDPLYYPEGHHVTEVCKVARGAATCRYLAMGHGGWSCQKRTAMKHVIDQKVLRDEMHARGDNCEGLHSR